MDAVLAYFGAVGGDESPSAQPSGERPPQFPAVRLLCFLGGPPSVGVGSVDTSRWGDAQASVFPSAPIPHSGDNISLFGSPHPVLDAAAAAADELAMPSTDFYTAAAARAAVRAPTLLLTVPHCAYVSSPHPCSPDAHRALALWWTCSRCQHSTHTPASLVIWTWPPSRHWHAPPAGGWPCTRRRSSPCRPRPAQGPTR